MVFEFDSAKSRANKKKHGIDFNEAQELWNSPTLELISKNQTELRRLVIGVIGKSHWTAIITYRGDSIRIISVRRSRDEEKEVYSRHYR